MIADWIDKVTREWIRNESDEKAARNGCRFDPERGQFVIDWAKQYLKLYEGDAAGQPLIARDWQIEATMRLFSWVKHSERWGREVRRFREASIWVPKKNKKSPTLAWWGLYLLMGDGEQGQKVFLGAKDGMQAREIAGKHAIEMLMASDVLMAECSINKSLMQITHEPTRSILKPLSSGNARHQQSKEGINGSVLIDETHVVDQDFISRISRAGISRSEPLRVEVSTAGKDPDCYGKKRFDYGMQVESGNFTDERLFFLSYAAPQDVSDEEICSNPRKYFVMANPAHGHTVDEEDFVSDLNSSKQSMGDFSDFKMYRLNVWQQSRNPWIRYSDWKKCAQSYTEEDLAGEECWLGMDLSKTKDMSSVVLVFRDGDDAFKLLPYFWMPENEAIRNSHLAAFPEWGREGHLRYCADDTIDQRVIRAEIQRLAKLFKIHRVIYDKTYAEEMTKDLQELDGLEREEFRQTIMTFASPSADFERLIIAGKLHHNDHPILNWQMGHVQYKEDNNNNRRPVKPRNEDHKKVDGVVATIMGLSGALLPAVKPSVYETRGPLIFGGKR